jgi:hypothetical protein
MRSIQEMNLSTEPLIVDHVPETLWSPIPPDQVWDRLTPEQQKTIFQALVMFCCSLIQPTHLVEKNEVPHERT